MSQVQYAVNYREQRNRLTTAFRIILAIPHIIVLSLWGIAAYVVALVQWFVILFTGKRNQGMFEFENNFLGYYSRVLSYYDLLYDEYPKFGTDPSGVPMSYAKSYEEPANRLTNGLRFIWIIPAAFIAYFLGIAAFAVAVVLWFVIVFTGKSNDGMWGFVHKVAFYSVQLAAYGLLMTDTYPKFADPVGAGEPAPPPLSQPGPPPLTRPAPQPLTQPAPQPLAQPAPPPPAAPSNPPPPPPGA